MRYIGFDMGDGESAVAIYEQGSGIEPMIQSLYGSRSLISAVGTLNGDTVIGEQAFTSVLSENLSVRFKSRFTDDPGSYDIIVRFARGVLTALRDANAVRPEDRFVVGCPAGWNAAARARYRDLLVRAGMNDPQVISESRAAFLYAKYAKTVALDLDILRQSALVIDIGSSTLDYAYIVDGRETGVGTFGDTHLGGGLIDAEILRRAVEKSRDRQALQRVFAQSRSWLSYCEIQARRLKEQFYLRLTQEPDVAVRKPLRVCYDGIQKATLTLTAQEAESIVQTPLEALDGLSFEQALQASLQNAAAVTKDAPPRLVLLTGGASRMPFFQAQCGAMFPQAVIVMCPEPEFSIAKGLAYAGWVDDNLRAFRQAIRDEMTEERIGAVAARALPELIPSVAGALVELTVREAASPVLSAWKRGDIATLNQMNEQLQRRAERVLASPLAEQALAPVLADWLSGLAATLQTMVDPICDRFHVPREEMRLNLNQSGNMATVRVGVKDLMGFSVIGAMVALAAGLFGAELCGGGGIALIVSGPLGWLAGAAAGAALVLLGWPAVTAAMMNMNLPLVLRRVNTEKTLQSEKFLRALRQSFLRELNRSEGPFSQKIVSGFVQAFQQYLFRTAQSAEVPIR
ncbi:MAG: Hsp70 family protein [Clostridiales bacterium]|nr:Hsp70 family protein [Clostridiales bacterium]